MADGEPPRFSVLPGGLDGAEGKVVAIPRQTPKPRAAGKRPSDRAPSDREIVAGLARRRDELRAEAAALAERARRALDAAATVQAAIEVLGGED